MKKFLILLALCSSTFAYSYTAFCFTTGKNTLGINPYLYGFKIESDIFGGGDLCAAYGITDKFDVYADVNYLYGAGAGTFGWWIMPRYDFGGTKILAIKANDLMISPQFHFIQEWTKFALQANAAVQLTYDYPKDPAVFAVVCPLFKFNDKLDAFCEVNPSYTMAEGDLVMGWVRPKGFGLDIVPGIGFKLGELLFSVSVPIYDITGAPTPSIGMWGLYLITFGKK